MVATVVQEHCVWNLHGASSVSDLMYGTWQPNNVDT
jgi:hypothetical protein